MAQAVAAWGSLPENRRASVWCATVLSHGTLLIQRGSLILYYTILYYTILYYTILYYTILYHPILSYPRLD